MVGFIRTGSLSSNGEERIGSFPKAAKIFFGICMLLFFPYMASAQERAGTGTNAGPSHEPVLAVVTVRGPDEFYISPPHVPNKPGVLLRSEPLKDAALPNGMTGWRILYTTTVDDKTPATAVATVFAAADRPVGPRPVINWLHGTTGLLQKCMPSLVSAPTIGIPAQVEAIKAGWVIVATDYAFAEQGGPHPYIIGEGEARSGLDAVRAAHQMSELTLDARTAVWGHSQGGHSALWTGIIASRYAPELDIVGVAAVAPAANIAQILKMNPALDRRLGPYIAASYSRFYPDITFEAALRPEALAAARQIVELCSFFPPENPERINRLTATFGGPALAADSNPALASRLAENTADRPIPVPVIIVQGEMDTAVLPEATEAYVKERCAAGQNLEYWTISGSDHRNIVQPDSPLSLPLVAWTAARFDKKPFQKDCSRRSF